MDTAIVSCQTISDEVNQAIQATGVGFDVHWIDSKLHLDPKKLNAAIQETVSGIRNAGTILLAFGYCGNGLEKVRSETARLVAPKAQDCISLLIGSEERRVTLSAESLRYYFTKGWLESEINVGHEYQYSVERFGRDRALRMFRTMLKGYKNFTLIDTGTFEVAPYEQKVSELAAEFGLDHCTVKGSPRLLEKLLTGPWDEEFLVVQPGHEITKEGLLGWDLH